MMKSKFDLIVEGALTRYQGTNFLVGDRIKFIENFLQHEWAKKQPEVKLERLKQLIESGDNLRISAIKTDRPNTAQNGHFEMIDGFYVDVIREKAPGLFMPQEIYTVPQELVELQEDYPNLSGKTPDSQIKDDPTQIKPSEVDVDDHDLSPVKQTGMGEGDRQLRNKDENISKVSPAKSDTGKYMS